jgi:prepilin-type N-terminal cleavage/methylation domain-containing protein
MPSPTRPIRPHRRPTGFTLVELMVSVALVLVLILGVTQVFSLTQKTISATSGLGDAIRSNKAVQQTMVSDLKNAALPGTGMGRGGPFFVIVSERIAAFKSREDQEADLDYNPANVNHTQVDDAILSEDANGDNDESNDVYSRVALSGRNHRIDMLGFFVRDRFRRQTGNDGAYAADMTANEGYVWYGHLRQMSDAVLNNARYPGYKPLYPTNPTSPLPPPNTVATNPYNFYSQQWILGRFAMLLVEPTIVGTDRRIFRTYDSSGAGVDPQFYVGRSTSPSATSLSPINYNAGVTNNGPIDTTTAVQHSRYDLAGTSIQGFTDILAGVIRNGRANWWDEAGQGSIYRYTGSPYPDKPITSAGAARTVPCFIPACSQFAVEYAGDFITQLYDADADGVLEATELRDPSFGNFVRAEPDGVTDFIVVNAGTANVKAETRWYGFPRNVDTSDDDVTNGREVISTAATSRDVIPLYDVAGQIFSFEKIGPSTAPRAVPDYGKAGAFAYNARYACAWSPAGSSVDSAGNPIPDPPLPKMIRFVVGVDDTDGRLTDPQIYEYVVELP